MEPTLYYDFFKTELETEKQKQRVQQPICAALYTLCYIGLLASGFGLGKTVMHPIAQSEKTAIERIQNKHPFNKSDLIFYTALGALSMMGACGTATLQRRQKSRVTDAYGKLFLAELNQRTR